MLAEQLLQKNFEDFANILSPVYGHANGFLQHPIFELFVNSAVGVPPLPVSYTFGKARYPLTIYPVSGAG